MCNPCSIIKHFLFCFFFVGRKSGKTLFIQPQEVTFTSPSGGHTVDVDTRIVRGRAIANSSNCRIKTLFKKKKKTVHKFYQRLCNKKHTRNVENMSRFFLFFSVQMKTIVFSLIFINFRSVSGKIERWITDLIFVQINQNTGCNTRNRDKRTNIVRRVAGVSFTVSYCY